MRKGSEMKANEMNKAQLLNEVDRLRKLVAKMDAGIGEVRHEFNRKFVAVSCARETKRLIREIVVQYSGTHDIFDDYRTDTVMYVVLEAAHCNLDLPPAVAAVIVSYEYFETEGCSILDVWPAVEIPRAK